MSCDNEANETVASRRFRNSGENKRLISACSSPACLALVKPMLDLDRFSAPALVVMMIVTFLKSALRPLLSVSVPWSMT